MPSFKDKIKEINKYISGVAVVTRGDDYSILLGGIGIATGRNITEAVDNAYNLVLRYGSKK